MAATKLSESGCRLAKRIQRYADENGNTIEGVVIEALDALLGGRMGDGFK